MVVMLQCLQKLLCCGDLFMSPIVQLDANTPTDATAHVHGLMYATISQERREAIMRLRDELLASGYLDRHATVEYNNQRALIIANLVRNGLVAKCQLQTDDGAELSDEVFESIRDL
jgi:hypothetical protein